MNPLVIAAFNRSVVYFMTKVYVSRHLQNPFLDGSYAPYLQTKRWCEYKREKNIEVFKKCTETLLKIETFDFWRRDLPMIPL